MKLILEKGQQLFFTSDTHYSHSNICRATTRWAGSENLTRDFKSLDHMNDTLANNINEMVGENDVLIHLGDWSFGGFENIQKFRDRIVCKEIHLILGNHDHHTENNRDHVQGRFLSVQHYLEVKINDRDFVLCHYPLQSWHGMNKGVIHLHGHVHLSENRKFGNGKKMDVGVDGNGMDPYSIDEIIKIMDKRPVAFEMNGDHHFDGLVGVVG